MKIVVDTNVLVSGLLSPYHAQGEIVRMIASDHLQLCFDARILTEYRQVLLRPKFRLDKQHVAYFLEQIQSCGELVAALPLKDLLPHPEDQSFLDIAVAGNVPILVTGNIKHFPRSHYYSVQIVSTSKFNDRYRKEIS